MYTRISSLIPNPHDLLALEVEELAGVLLVHLNSYDDDSENFLFQSQIDQQSFFRDMDINQEYGD